MIVEYQLQRTTESVTEEFPAPRIHAVLQSFPV